MSLGKSADDRAAAVTEEVREVIAKQLKLPLARITRDTALQDLGVESLDLIEIIFALEEKFEISIPFNANEAAGGGKGDSAGVGLGKLETVQQISAAIEELLQAKTAA